MKLRRGYVYSSFYERRASYSWINAHSDEFVGIDRVACQLANPRTNSNKLTIAVVSRNRRSSDGKEIGACPFKSWGR